MSTICTICGGNAGRLSPEGYHFLCKARQDLNLPTPSLGTRCGTCKGSGYQTATLAGPVLDFSLGPQRIARAIDAWAKKCPDCCSGAVTKWKT